MPLGKGAPFHPNIFLSKSSLRKLKKGQMLINLPDVLILQKKKPIQNTTEKFYMEILAYPSSTQSPRVLWNRFHLLCPVSRTKQISLS